MFTNIIFAFYLFAGMAICYMVFVNLLAVIHKRQGSVFTIAGTVFMAMATINDNLYSSFFISTSTFIELGMVVYVFFQALNLSLRLTGAFSKVESLTQSLARENNGLETEIVSRTRELQETSESLLNLEKIRSTEEERKKLGRDLHDGMGQSVHALELLVTGFSSGRTFSTKEQEILNKITTTAGDIKDGLYRIIGELYPVPEGNLGLIAAVERLAVKTEFYYSIPVKLLCSGPITWCDERTTNDIYFIISEALTNAVRHAEPAQVTINMQYKMGMLAISISNNGIHPDPVEPEDNGFDVHSPGYGLRIMKYRAISHNGTFSAGTRVIEHETWFEVNVEIPMETMGSEFHEGNRSAIETAGGTVGYQEDTSGSVDT